MPPSFLYRNRLFLERDSKHRRVMVNLGVTFRNSKWSAYGRKNVSLQFVQKYLRNLGLLTLLILLTIFFNPTNLVDNLWGALDTTLSNVLFFYFFGLAVIHGMANQVYAAFFTRFTEGSLKPLTFHSPTTKPENVSINAEPTLVYNWLAQPTSSVYLENFFSQPAHSPVLKLKLTKNLFQLTQPLILLNSTGKLKASFLTTNASNYVNTPALNFPLQSLELFLQSKVQSPFRSSKASRKERFQWLLSSTDTPSSNVAPIRYAKSGNFYLSSLSTQQLTIASLKYAEMGACSDLLASQKAVIQRNAWLYKFSTLNRNVLSHSKNITRTKSFLSNTFTQFSLATKNIWAANEVNFDKQTGVLQRSLFSNSTLNPNTSNFNLSSVPLSSLDFNLAVRSSELSYLWLVKRLYFFNNLTANQSVSSPVVSLPTQQLPLSTAAAPQLNLQVLTTYILQNPHLASDFRQSLVPNLTNSSKTTYPNASKEPLTLNYTNYGVYTNSFATLATEFASTAVHNDRSNVYVSPLTFENTQKTIFTTTLSGLTTDTLANTTSLKTTNISVARELTALSDLRLIYMLF